MTEPVNISRIVIKPTLACTADCYFCLSRRSLHKSLIRSQRVSLDRWRTVVTDAKKLGAEYLVISGGEPTLYRNLLDLVKLGRELGLVVTVNSNGFLLNEKRIKELLEAGLNSICISLHHHIPEIFDQMRAQKGLWKRATQAVQIFYRLTRNNPNFSLQTQGIICRENYKTFHELIALHYQLGSQIMRISYMEGDFEKKNLLTAKEISEFKTETIPKAIQVCQRFLDKSLQPNVIEVLQNIYSEKNASLEQYAQGIYQPGASGQKPCHIPLEQAGPILANGDVHPCNVVEYSHRPIAGNISEKELPEIWKGDLWNRFRAEPFEYCQYCPMPIHPNIQMRKKPLSVMKQIKHALYPLRDFLLSRKIISRHETIPG